MPRLIPRSINRQPTPTNEPIKNGPEILNFIPVLELPAASANRNVYGRVNGVMTESTPYNPCNRKGEVRARIATTFMDEVTRWALRGAIVRAADFYGPGAMLSVTHATVTDDRFVN